MIKEANIRKLIDYTLLNACSVNSSGLYNGKAGISLALFVAARYLQDEYIEEQAFKLLQEALLSKADDISFENGLSGIGYVLLYIIENDFIEADFNELFSKQIEKILLGCDKSKENPNALLNSIRMTCFFASVKSSSPANKRADKLMKTLFEASELYLGIQFFDIKNINYISNKKAVLKRFETYLHMVCECRYADFSRVVLDNYANLYRSGRIISSYKVAHYLQILDAENRYKDVIESNKRYSDFNNMQACTLRDWIDSSYLKGEADVLQKFLSEENKGNIEKTILRLIPQGAFVAGYEQGISRLLLCLTTNNFKLF